MDKKTKIIIGCALTLFFQFKIFPDFTLKILTEIDKYLSLTFGLKRGVSSLVAGVVSGLIFSYSSTYLLRKAVTALLSHKYNENIETGIVCVSSKYMQEMKNKLYTTEKFILIIAGYFFFSYFFIPISISVLASLFYSSIFLLIFLSILITKELLIEYRIKRGLFGTNRTEARELIDFIIKNSDNLDFTDSNGNLRRALLPEAKDAVEERISGTLGEEARA
ncbi:hypothetical protein [Candidatus Electronema sp. JM]|uniref:hypothetical protein n=1 Tax=Candidatus Electronema sp. JM TaxID=3401571 RepID=UPI003AA9A348